MANAISHSLRTSGRDEIGRRVTDATADVDVDLSHGYQAIVHVETAAASGVTVDIQTRATGGGNEQWRSVLTGTVALGASDGRHWVVDYGYRHVRVACTAGSGTYDVHIAAVRR